LARDHCVERDRPRLTESHGTCRADQQRVRTPSATRWAGCRYPHGADVGVAATSGCPGLPRRLGYHEHGFRVGHEGICGWSRRPAFTGDP